jgi:hypothetical protein
LHFNIGVVFSLGFSLWHFEKIIYFFSQNFKMQTGFQTFLDDLMRIAKKNNIHIRQKVILPDQRPKMIVLTALDTSCSIWEKMEIDPNVKVIDVCIWVSHTTTDVPIELKFAQSKLVYKTWNNMEGKCECCLPGFESDLVHPQGFH